MYGLLDADALLARVDAVEGYTPDDVPHSQYIRTAVPVSLGPERAWAWAYFYQPSLGSAVWIPSGDYRRHVTRAGQPVQDVNASTKLVIAAATWLETSTNSIPE